MLLVVDVVCSVGLIRACRVSDEGGKMTFSKVKSGSVSKSDFKSQVHGHSSSFSLL